MVGTSVEVPQPQRSWLWSRWKRPWLCSSSSGASIRPVPDWESGEGRWSTHTFGQLRNRGNSISPWSSSPAGLTPLQYLPVGSSLPPEEAISCRRRHPVLEWPTGSNCSPAGQPSSTQLRAVSLVLEGARPTENLPVGHCSHGHSVLRTQMGPRRG